jgi:hypothetical protein
MVTDEDYREELICPRRSPLLIWVAQEYDFVLYSPYVGLGTFGEDRASPVALRCCDRRRPLARTHQRAGS